MPGEHKERLLESSREVELQVPVPDEGSLKSAASNLVGGMGH